MNNNPEDMGKKVIKAYIYMRYENMLQVLARRALKVLSYDECNDPYEFMPAGPEGEALQHVYQTGFISFSSRYQSGAMWGHYGDKHRGVCLEFTFPLYQPTPEEESPPYYILNIQLNEEDAQIPFPTKTAEGKLLHRNYGVLFKMRYRKEKEPFNYDIVSCGSAGPVLDCHVDGNLITKDESWEYEDELRILISMEEKGKFVSCFHPYLTGIILGIKCQKDVGTVEKIVELFREEGDGPVQVYQAQYSEQTFDVQVPGLENVTSKGSPTRTSSQEG